MKHNILRPLALAVGFVMCSAAAQAATVQWVVDGALGMNTGATATGSFVYDADTNIYSDVMITVSGTTASGSTDGLYDTSTLVASHNFELVAFIGMPPANLFGVQGFSLKFLSALTNAGGTVSLSLIGTIECRIRSCGARQYNNDQAYFQNAPIGTITGTPSISPVPLPAGLPLLLGSIGIMGALRRRKRST